MQNKLHLQACIGFGDQTPTPFFSTMNRGNEIEIAWKTGRGLVSKPIVCLVDVAIIFAQVLMMLCSPSPIAVFNGSIARQALPLLLLLPIAIAMPGNALPPPDDVPEEILRTEIITEARSPIDGEPLSAAEYAALLETLEREGIAFSPRPTAQTPLPSVSPERSIINRLPVRELLRVIFPF